MSADDQLPGLEVPESSAGRVERTVRAALTAAALDTRDHGAGELAAGLARAVDLALNRRDPYAVAQAGRELRETLTRLRMDPVAREGNDAGALQTFLDGLSAAEPESSPHDSSTSGA